MGLCRAWAFPCLNELFPLLRLTEAFDPQSKRSTTVEASCVWHTYIHALLGNLAIQRGRVGFEVRWQLCGVSDS
jgi:hypothetical protein